MILMLSLTHGCKPVLARSPQLCQDSQLMSIMGRESCLCCILCMFTSTAVPSINPLSISASAQPYTLILKGVSPRLLSMFCGCAIAATTGQPLATTISHPARDPSNHAGTPTNPVTLASDAIAPRDTVKHEDLAHDEEDELDTEFAEHMGPKLWCQAAIGGESATCCGHCGPSCPVPVSASLSADIVCRIHLVLLFWLMQLS